MITMSISGQCSSEDSIIYVIFVIIATRAASCGPFLSNAINVQAKRGGTCRFSQLCQRHLSQNTEVRRRHGHGRRFQSAKKEPVQPDRVLIRTRSFWHPLHFPSQGHYSDYKDVSCHESFCLTITIGSHTNFISGSFSSSSQMCQSTYSSWSLTVSQERLNWTSQWPESQTQDLLKPHPVIPPDPRILNRLFLNGQTLT